MLRRRVIVCLDVHDGRVVKGTSFADLRDVGDPVQLASRYEADGADEVVFLDISASAEGRSTLLDVVRRTATNLSIPLTVGGGIRDVDDIGRVLRAGADKIGVNTAAVARPALIGEAADRFGRQCVVVSIDAFRDGERYGVRTHGGRDATGLDAIAWAARASALGAGEILITSIDQDGRRSGYDLELTARTVEAVTVPVIASGGAGTALHVRDAFLRAGADAALLAGVLHDGSTSVGAIKDVLAQAGVPVRIDPARRQLPSEAFS